MTVRREPDIARVVNDLRSWSGRPAVADALTSCRGAMAGFRNPGRRDRSDAATRMFDGAIAAQDGQVG